MTHRTTIKNYDADLLTARAWFDEKTAFRFNTTCPTEIDAQIDKAIDDALNNEWQRNISINAWVERAIEVIVPTRRR